VYTGSTLKVDVIFMHVFPCLSSFFACSNTSRDDLKEWIQEKFLDLKYPLIDLFQAAAWGVFERPLFVIKHFFTTIHPEGIIAGAYKNKYSLIQLTKGNIENNLIYSQMLPNGTQAPSQERLHYLLTQVHALANKMGIKQEVQVYAGERCCETGMMGGTFAISASFIQFSAQQINDSNETLDHVIAHELFHINRNHRLKQALFEGAVLVIEILAVLSIAGIVFLSFEGAVLIVNVLAALSIVVLIPLIEAVARKISLAIRRSQEKQADIEGMRVLGTNRGAIAAFEQGIAKNLETKNNARKILKVFSDRFTPEFQKKINPLNIDWDGIRTIFNKYTPAGDNRTDLEHPPLSVRLAYCKAFSLQA
jgi:Zn-dependent protease with chaperone function